MKNRESCWCEEAKVTEVGVTDVRVRGPRRCQFRGVRGPVNRTDKRKRRKQVRQFHKLTRQKGRFFFLCFPLAMPGVSCVEKAFAMS